MQKWPGRVRWILSSRGEAQAAIRQGSLAAVLGVLAVLVLPAAPASAHAKLTGSNPQAGQTITATIPAITLSFSGPVKAEVTTILVAGPDGVNMSNGRATLSDVTLTQPVNPLPPGQIKVTWRTVSVDGHTIEGTFDFTNAAPGSSASPSAPVADSSTPAAAGPATAGPVATEPTSDEGGMSPVVWIVLAILVVAAAAGGGFWYRKRSS